MENLPGGASTSKFEGPDQSLLQLLSKLRSASHDFDSLISIYLPPGGNIKELLLRLQDLFTKSQQIPDKVEKNSTLSSIALAISGNVAPSRTG